MFNRLIRRLLNRRQASSRFPLCLRVKTTSATGDDLEITSEDVSESGIRLRFESYGIADILGHRDELPMEIFLEAEVAPVNVQGKLIWAFAPAGGGAVSGWEFVELKGRSLRRFRTYIGSGGRSSLEDNSE